MTSQNLSPRDGTYFSEHPNREFILRAHVAGDPAPLFGNWLPAYLQEPNGDTKRMNLAVLVHRSGAIRLFYVSPSLPLGADWTREELAELVSAPPWLVDLQRKRGYDASWVGLIPAPTA